jgi:hypothetical protein
VNEEREAEPEEPEEPWYKPEQVNPDPKATQCTQLLRGSRYPHDTTDDPRSSS